MQTFNSVADALGTKWQAVDDAQWIVEQIEVGDESAVWNGPAKHVVKRTAEGFTVNGVAAETSEDAAIMIVL